MFYPNHHMFSQYSWAITESQLYCPTYLLNSGPSGHSTSPVFQEAFPDHAYASLELHSSPGHVMSLPGVLIVHKHIDGLLPWPLTNYESLRDCILWPVWVLMSPFSPWQFLFERVEGISRATIVDLDAHQVSAL